MSPVSKALGVLVAVNTQAAVYVILGFWGKDYLEAHMPLPFPWVYILVPLILIAIVHSYYVMLRYLWRVDQEMRGGKDKKKG